MKIKKALIKKKKIKINIIRIKIININKYKYINNKCLDWEFELIVKFSYQKIMC
jgi:hypothetical protein